MCPRRKRRKTLKDIETKMESVLEIYVIKRVLSYMACGAAVVVGGQAWLILLYRGYITRHFSLSYYADKFVISAGILGSSFGLPVAYLLKPVGVKWSTAFSLCVACLGLASLWIVTSVPFDLQPPYPVLALCFFVSGSGAAMCLLTGMVTSLCNAPRRHRAMMSAIMGLLYETSTQVIQLIRRLGFRSYMDSVLLEDRVLPRVTLVLITLTIIAGTFAVFFIRAFQESRYLEEEDDGRLLCAIGSCKRHLKMEEPDLCSTNALQWISSESIWRLLGTFEYQCLIWSAGLFLALSQFSRLILPPVIPNKPSTNELTLTLTCIYSFSAILTRFPLACLVDTFHERLFVYLVLLCVKILGLFGQFLLFLDWSRLVLITYYAISGIVDGVCFFEIIVLTCQMFGNENLARNIALPLMMKSVIITFLQYFHDGLSLNHVQDASESFCYGISCEFNVSLVRLFLAIIAVGFFCPLIIRRSTLFKFSRCRITD